MSEPHPIQPLITDENGVRRFKQNAIVRYLIDCGSIDVNAIGLLPFSQDDREQFAQLIGYSLSGFSKLSYVSDATWDRVMAKPGGLTLKPAPVGNPATKDTDFEGTVEHCGMCGCDYIHPHGSIAGLGKCHDCFMMLWKNDPEQSAD